MILYQIFKAIEAKAAGIDSVPPELYNIIKPHKEVKAMELMSYTENHPEQEQIFYLAKMITEAGYPFYFNFLDDLRPTPFNQDGGNPEADIIWDEYKFLIEVGRPAGAALSEISITFNQEGDKTLLELLDMRNAPEGAAAEAGELTRDMKAEECMEIIERYFESI